MFAPMPAKPPLQLPAKVVPVAAYTPLPPAQVLLLTQPWNPFDKAQHEAHMNAWLMSYTQTANQAKLALYDQAYNDWRTNAQIYSDLGMSVPDAPKPPTLDPVAPMPAGYWFQ